MGGRSSGKDAKAEPNLELPSFRLRRKKKPAEPSVVTPEPSVLTPEPPVLTPEPSVAPAAGGPSVHVVPPPPLTRTTPTPPVVAKRSAPPPPEATRRQPRLTPPPPPPAIAVVEDEPTRPMPPTEEAKARSAKPPKAARTPKPRKPAKEPKRARQPKAAKQPRPAPKPPKATRERSIAPPAWLPGYVAAIVTGAFSGGLTVALAWGTGQGCAQLRGVGTCGGYGVFALVIILGIDVVLATGLLRLFRVTDPATTAMLGVGLVAVLAMLFFLGQTQSFAMVYVIPVLMAGTFTFAWWITKAIAQRVED